MDLFAEAEGLRRRRALLESLAARSAAPQIQGSGGVAQLLAALATQAQAKQGLGRIDSALQDNEARYGGALASEFDRFMTRREGTPDTPSEWYDDPGVRGTPGDPKGAVFEALASRFPEMKEVGKAGLREMTTWPPRGRADKPEEQWVEEYRDIDGKKVLVRKNTRTGKVEAVGQGPAVQVNMGDRAGEQAAAKAAVESVDSKSEGFKTANTARQDLERMPEILYALNNGAVTGSFGELRQAFRKFGEFVGVPSANTAPTDTLAAMLKERVFTRMGGLGVAVSDADRRFVDAAAGNLDTDPRALKVLLAHTAAYNMRQQNLHNKRVTRVGEKYPDVLFNDVPLNFVMPDDPEFEKMVLAAFQGRSAAEAAGWNVAPRAATPAPAPAPSPYGDPRIRDYVPPGKRP